MLKKEWKALKSGTDIRGVASEGAGQPVSLTDNVVERLAAAFARWLSEKTGLAADSLQIALGRDSRVSGPRIASAAARALQSAGVQVVDCGLASTPAMFMTTVDFSCHGAVQVTASHHPWFRNGLKFFTRSGGLDGPDIETLLLYAQEKNFLPGAAGTLRQENYMQKYAAHLRGVIQDGVGGEHPLTGFHIVVDAGNGAGGFYARDVLEPLGADITGSQFLEPDGMFPNHIPNPEDGTAMESVCSAVLRAGADLGVIFDTDVDRCGAVDAAGKEINRNRLVALASSIALDDAPGGVIVTDSITSSGLKEYIEGTLGGVHHRFCRGYKNVINEALRLNAEGKNCPLAIETSGHAALRENYFLDDGAYLITRIIIKAAQLRTQGNTLEDLLAPLKEPMEAKEIRLPIMEPEFRALGERVTGELEAHAKKLGWGIAPDNHEGLRVSFGTGEGDGWFLLRLSVHDPIMPLNIESDCAGGVRQIAEKLYDFLREFPGLDCTALKNYLRG